MYRVIEHRPNHTILFCRNLQAAICSYYDYEQPNAKVPCMAFVKDVTIGEGESVPPATRFVKTWRIQNIGKFIVEFLKLDSLSNHMCLDRAKICKNRCN